MTMEDSMKKSISTVALVATFALAGPLAAQQVQHRSSHDAGQASSMAAHMRDMDSLGTRVDSAIGLMNRSTGEARVNAMALALNALVAERKAMQAHMHQMHSHAMM